MEAFLKKFVMRDDGFLEVVLKRTKDFDDYLFQQIQKDYDCMPCIRDPRSKSKLFYDTKGLLSLRMYLQKHIFGKDELVYFLLYILEDMVKVNTSKPVFMHLDYVYLSYDGGVLRFLVFPVTQDKWMFQNEQCKSFIAEMIEEIKTKEGYCEIGYLVQSLKKENFRLPLLLHGLHSIRDERKKRISFLEKLFHLEKEEPYTVRDLPLPKAQLTPVQSQNMIMEEVSAYAVQEQKSEVLLDTIDLFQEVGNAYFISVHTKEKFYVNDEVFHIGRKKENQICIMQKSVSSVHAILYKDKDFLLCDQNSLNGTFVNREKIDEVHVSNGDQICFADECYIFYSGAHLDTTCE